MWINIVFPCVKHTSKDARFYKKQNSFWCITSFIKKLKIVRVSQLLRGRLSIKLLLVKL